MKLKVGAIVEARMTSSRLPGKHLLPVLGEPIIGHLINRLRSIPLIDEVIVAMTLRPEDDVLENYVTTIGASVFRGEEDDVMGRVLSAAQNSKTDIICEVTGDCPIIDVSLTEQVIKTYFANEASYVNNGKFSGLPDGMSCQVFSTETLAKSAFMTKEPLDREHVTLHIKRNPELFRAIYLVAEKFIQWPELAVTLDERSDYELIKRIIEFFGKDKPLFSCAEVIQLLHKYPDWLEINRHVKRKGDT